MAERMTNRPGDRAGGRLREGVNLPNSPECGLWETQLVDALDGILAAEDEAVFNSHKVTCAACAQLYEQARRGREWLEFLAPEPEIPANLLERILAETGHGKLAAGSSGVGKLAVAGGDVLQMPPVWQQPGFAARMRRFAEPRLMMTAAMAFFSIALTLSMTGVHISGIKTADLRPTSVRSMLEKRIMTASTPIIRYYDHLRFVYEVESRMRELRRSTESEQPGQPGDQPRSQPNTNGGEGETHKKDGGGSKLNPSEAPQQTVNPPTEPWRSDMLEAALQSQPRPRPLNQGNTNQSKTSRQNKGFPTLTGASGSFETGFLETSVLAMPERSTSCIA